MRHDFRLRSPNIIIATFVPLAVRSLNICHLFSLFCTGYLLVLYWLFLTFSICFVLAISVIIRHLLSLFCIGYSTDHSSPSQPVLHWLFPWSFVTFSVCFVLVISLIISSPQSVLGCCCFWCLFFYWHSSPQCVLDWLFHWSFVTSICFVLFPVCSTQRITIRDL